MCSNNFCTQLRTQCQDKIIYVRTGRLQMPKSGQFSICRNCLAVVTILEKRFNARDDLLTTFSRVCVLNSPVFKLKKVEGSNSVSSSFSSFVFLKGEWGVIAACVRAAWPTPGWRLFFSQIRRDIQCSECKLAF